MGSPVLVKGTTAVVGQGADTTVTAADRNNKQVVTAYTDYINKINSNLVDHAKDLHVVMLVYNLVECSDNYQKTSGSLQQYHKDNPNDNMTDSESFKYKSRLTNKRLTSNTNNVGIGNVEIVAPLKYL